MYLMQREADFEVQKADAQFKNMVFAQNPEMFKALFEDKKPEEDFEIEEFVPESEGDVNKMLAQLRRSGVIN